MGIVRSAAVMRDLENLWVAGISADCDDTELIARFLSQTENLSDNAFRTLVERHGRMVERTCRQILGDSHDAEEASQVVFLVLAKKAGSIRGRRTIAPWLHGVARRVARKVRQRATVRSHNEINSAVRAATLRIRGDEPEVDQDDWRGLHDEVARLPDKYRAPVVLCYLEGLTYEDAARRIGCPLGTVRVRLSRARDRLRDQLGRRGFGPQALATVLPAGPPVQVFTIPTALTFAWIEATSRAAQIIVSGRSSGAGLVSASVMSLTQEVLWMFRISKLKVLLFGGLTAAGMVVGVGTLLGQVPAPTGAAKTVEQPVVPARAKAAIDPEREAIRKLVEAARQRLEAQRKFYEEGRITIDRFLDASSGVMEAEILLATTRLERVNALEKHLAMVKDVEARERSELEVGRGTTADVAEAKQARERAELDLIKVKRDVPDVRELEKRIVVLEKKLERVLMKLELKDAPSR